MRDLREVLKRKSQKSQKGKKTQPHLEMNTLESLWEYRRSVCLKSALGEAAYPCVSQCHACPMSGLDNFSTYLLSRGMASEVGTHPSRVSLLPQGLIMWSLGEKISKIFLWDCGPQGWRESGAAGSHLANHAASQQSHFKPPKPINFLFA